MADKVAATYHPHEENHVAKLGIVKLNMRVRIEAGVADMHEVGVLELTIDAPLSSKKADDGTVVLIVSGLEDRLKRAGEAFEDALAEGAAGTP